MSSQTNNVTITLLYADDTTRNYTFEDVSADDLDDVNDKINAINANENNAYENFYKTFVSEDGAAVTSISACKLTNITEEVIYSG